MFQGLVEQTVKIHSITAKTGLRRFSFSFSVELVRGLKIGGSISIEGVCLTATNIDEQFVSVDIMLETLNKTTLGSFNAGDAVNIERAAKFGDEIGGHTLSGHIDTTAKIIKIEQPENNYIFTFLVDSEWRRYIFSKGYISINGASLTVTDFNKSEGTFKTYLIPETLRRTTFAHKRIGDFVNVEIDRQTQVIVETVERVLERNTSTIVR